MASKELQKKTKEWMQLERRTLAQRKEADAYYDLNLMNLIEEDFVKRNSRFLKEKVHHLVVSVGTSYEPVVLNISLMKPDKILFLYTETSHTTLNKIVEYCELKPTDYEKKQVSEVDPIDIYREIKNAYLAWNRPERMYIDFTGGTKAMSAACALAGAMVDVQMVYVASDDYLVDFRKPNPGSEKLVYVENPLSVFGELETEKALELFYEYNFVGAAEKIDLIKENIPNPNKRQELTFIHLLSLAYGCWDSLDFSGAYKSMKELCRQLDRDGRNFASNILVKKSDVLNRQKQYLEILSQIGALIRKKKQREILNNREMIIALMFSMGMNAMTRQEQGKNDMATLLMYRLLEMIEQRRLSRYNLFVSDMDYDNVMPDLSLTPELKGVSSGEKIKYMRGEVLEIRKKVFGDRASDYLPNPVSLLDGFILLSALRDPIIYREGTERINLLKKMRSMVYLRNNSIFAHGLGPVALADYERFRDFVLFMFRCLCQVEAVAFDDYNLAFRWVLPEKAGE